MAGGLALGLVAAATLAEADAPTGGVGHRFELKASSLPAPYSHPPVGKSAPNVVRPDGALPRVPDGFVAGIFAAGLSHPREMSVGPDGTIYVAQTREGNVLALRDSDGDGKADMRVIFADGFREPTGLVVQGDALYVADRRAVWRVGFDGEAMKALPRTLVTRPGALGTGGGHITREIVFAPDGEHFFVAIGSATNVGEDPHPRATIQQFRADGNAQTTYASGLRNPLGLAFYPGTDDLYAVVNERFGLGAGLVPDYFTRLTPHGFYGYPYAYIGAHADPQFGELRPDLVATSLAPDVLFQPHSGPSGLLFVTPVTDEADEEEIAAGLPPEWNGDALVALHGTRTEGASASAIVRLRFREGRPDGAYETIVAGFGGGPTGAKGGLWGRPVWLARARDGSLLVSDDVANVIWRIRWTAGDAVATVASDDATGGAARMATGRLPGPMPGTATGFATTRAEAPALSLAPRTEPVSTTSAFTPSH
tara:strand:+ start:6981 stop:8423 length:1443 start_codon:yes stop_codon:yes gene_type:complete